eukprot:Tbor_TRINITY_DN4213_c0_g1::TRINITY_DN4213_c0_g1_i4::g.24044::m.24044
MISCDRLAVACKSAIENSAYIIDLTGSKVRKLDDCDVGELSLALSNNSTVTELNLSLNNITDVGAKLLSGILSNLRTLTTLELDSNKLTDEGVVLILSVLSPSVHRIDLSGNSGVTDKSVEFLIDQMQKNPDRICVKNLFLRDCSISDKSLSLFCSWIIGGNCPLRVLHISGNCFTDKSIDCLRKALEVSNVLIDLNLGNSNIFNFSPLVSNDLVNNNKSLQSLVLSSNGKIFKDSRIDEMLLRNKKLAKYSIREVMQTKALHEIEREAIKSDYESRIGALEARIAELQGN